MISTTLLSTRNPGNSLDVNADGFNSPVDALWLINELKNGGSRPIEQVVVAADYQELATGAYLDPNGDGHLTPLDPLIVINFLNEQSISAAEGEGDADQATVLIAASTASVPFVNETAGVQGNERPQLDAAAPITSENDSKIIDDFGWQVAAENRQQPLRDPRSVDDELESLLDELADDVALNWKI